MPVRRTKCCKSTTCRPQRRTDRQGERRRRSIARSTSTAPPTTGASGPSQLAAIATAAKLIDLVAAMRRCTRPLCTVEDVASSAIPDERDEHARIYPNGSTVPTDEQPRTVKSPSGRQATSTSNSPATTEPRAEFPIELARLDGTGRAVGADRRRVLRPHARPARPAQPDRPRRQRRGRPARRPAPHRRRRRHRPRPGDREGPRRQARHPPLRLGDRPDGREPRAGRRRPLRPARRSCST